MATPPPLPRVFPTMVHMLAEAATRWPAREALVAGGVRLDYRDYLSCVAGFARELAALDVRGERVASILPNGIEICVATFGAQAAGAQLVPLNPLYTERELAAILADAAPKVLLYDAARRDLIEPLARRCGIAQLIAVNAGDGAFTRWAGQDVPLPAVLPQPEDLAFVQYTGGTTGRSKGVVLSHRAASINVSQREGLLPTGAALGRAPAPEHIERILCVMPLFHTYAISMGMCLAAYCGGALVALPRYHPQEVLQALVDERITIFPGSPTIFTGLMAHEAFARTDFSRIHTCYSGSAPLPEETLRRWEEAVRAPVYEGFGQTEAGPVISFNPVVGARKPGSVGVAVADTEIQIVDTDSGTTVLASGEKGEIRVRGPQVMNGYRNLPQETAAALREGWLYTGDIGEIDAEGYLTIRDRKKDMVIVGGYNVYPREVDEVLTLHPAVQEAASVGAPDAYRGEVVRAFVVLRPGASTNEGEILAHCARNLARYKVPVSVAIVDALPKTGVNKTDKNALRALAAAQRQV